MSFFVAEIIEGVRRGGGSPLRPFLDETSVDEEVSSLIKLLINFHFKLNLTLLIRVNSNNSSPKRNKSGHL